MDNMEKAFIFPDVTSFECSSPSELDRKFFGEQSLLSALSLDQLSTSRLFNNTTADGFDRRPSILASLCLSSDAISPCEGFSPHGPGVKESNNCNLCIPLQGKFSTPQVHIKKPKNATCFDQSYGDLTASNVSWDVSMIKSESSNSPRVFMESSTQEQTWSPKPQQQSLPEVSP
ncbi:uncharacterized protein si:ch73-303b9.1 [Fundulus heteroclitus]|uniref:uncharacterized protein si:ch73-303b9.1 n=1 Tax=Fundulus heteroclitus TaxID=8078 RepID=UPI00165BC861|nr:uncharacterized protein si:ch73-303b9.1 [Fundulus heteroclitus]